MKNFWQTLPKPFFAQSPMEDAADSVFRQMLAICGAPDVYFTEFVSVEALTSAGIHSAQTRLFHTKKEQPIIAQFWGNTPDHYVDAVKTAKKMNFSGIDINMGCPVRDVVGKGYCSGLIQNPDLAAKLIQTTQKAAGNDLSVSVKTRIGYKAIEIEKWIGFLLSFHLDALSIHLRTTKEQSLVPAHWKEMGKIIALRDKISPQTVIIGNGDIQNREDGLQKAKKYNVDGIMIGRGLLHDLWALAPASVRERVTTKEKLARLIDHIKLFEKTWKRVKSYHVVRKHFKAYIHGVEGASHLRARLMEFQDAKETIKFLSTYHL
jgi:tRNA-dihydrouridine synthase